MHEEMITGYCDKNGTLKRIGNHSFLGGEQHPLGHAGLGILIVHAHGPGTQAQGSHSRTSRMNSLILVLEQS